MVGVIFLVLGYLVLGRIVDHNKIKTTYIACALTMLLYSSMM